MLNFESIRPKELMISLLDIKIFRVFIYFIEKIKLKRVKICIRLLFYSDKN